MKSKTLKLIPILLIIVVALSLCAGLFGCDKDKKQRERDEKLRVQSVETIEDAFLNILDEGWSANMSDEQLVATANVGDYIVAKGWTQLFCDTLYASALQTAKLRNLSDALTSDEGNALLENFNENAELLLPVLREVGFTKEDISALFYDLVTALVGRSRETLMDIGDELMRVRQMKGLTVASAQNLGTCIGDISAAIEDLAPTQSEKTEMLNAFEEASDAVEATIGFAYDMFFNTLSDEMWSDLFEGGALENISDSEIEIVMDSMLDSIDDLRKVLTTQNVRRLNAALSMFISNFDEEELSSVMFAQIVTYAKSVNMFVGATHMALDVVSSVGEVIGTPQMIANIKDNAESWQADSPTKVYNAAALFASLTQNFMGRYDEASLCAEFDGLAELCGSGSDCDIDQAALLMGVDLLLNLAGIDPSAQEDSFFVRHPDAVSGDDLTDMISAAFFMKWNLDSFKENYYKFRRGEAQLSNVIAALNRCNFAELGVQFSEGAITAENVGRAYGFFMSEGLAAVKRHIAPLIAKAVRDIKMFVSDYYAEGSAYRAALEKIAEREFVNASPSQEMMDELNKDLVDCGMFGIVYLLTGANIA